ncbi:16S rRNA (adenine(1518)-N(6)/adenine(1519)-N(6))-dimethyltransferase RsmA [Metamycoplasma buccale]|uniref:16S rRNA (adenine(1518)-N(6)/adenine(1519)-N(6))- dimethyltransferase RsmA n=1 Tax=Metamycoplasma buccale TaxID=55602 RepID=UPI00398F3DD0
MKIIAKKKFGQNFLINKEIQKKIIDIANVYNEKVIEIGPGLGALTFLMLDKVKYLKAYEIDNQIYSLLKQKIKNQNFEIINENFLNAKLNEEKEIVIVGNIPYNITSDILFKLIENHNSIKRAILMVQKEVGNRICAIPGTKEYSKLTVSLNCIANCKKELTVLAKEFDPIPKVDSMVVSINFDKELEFDLISFLNFIKKIFQYKRKTLLNNINQFYSKEKILNSLNKLSLNINIRSEELDITTIKNLYTLLENH